MKQKHIKTDKGAYLSADDNLEASQFMKKMNEEKQPRQNLFKVVYQEDILGNNN